jgi:hypothetical protein
MAGAARCAQPRQQPERVGVALEACAAPGQQQQRALRRQDRMLRRRPRPRGGIGCGARGNIAVSMPRGITRSLAASVAG